MDEEIEDAVGDIKYTDSQKSVATSNVYSLDFTDSSSDRHNSSGKETYIIEWEDSEDSELYSADTDSVIHIGNKSAKTSLIIKNIQCEVNRKNNKTSSTSVSNIIAQEMYTQTSKTIIELAEHEIATHKASNSHTLETQTSIISITENQTINYTIQVSRGGTTLSRNEAIGSGNELPSITYNAALSTSLEDESSKFPISETENERSEDFLSENSSDGKIIKIIDADSKEYMSNDGHNDINIEQNSDFDDSISDTSDIDEDSLECHNVQKCDKETNRSDTPKSVDNDVAELYNKISESIDLHISQRYFESDKRRCGTLTPLTEESTVKRESLMDLTPNAINKSDDIVDNDKDILFTNAGIKVKLLSNSDPDTLKLPPIQPHSGPSSPNLSYIPSNPTVKPLPRPSLFPCVFETQRERRSDRWEIGRKELASGESPLISNRSGKSDHSKLFSESFQLPRIHIEGYIISDIDKTESRVSNISKTDSLLSGHQQSPISIKDKIKELKICGKNHKQCINHHNTLSESRSCSPSSGSPDEIRLCDAAERGCEALCVEMLRRLRSHSWFDIADTMTEMPRALDKFWGVITEQRIADLIRQVSTHVESPRTQVARTACSTLAAILRNTNYTKKPDFHEAISILLTKTGSFSRPVRRAANVALDDVVCAVELSQAISALCVHGASHKSHLVRCACARLLVVCCALGGGGRDVLRARPPTAAMARKHALRALSSLLDDKNSDARKYAERLYSMLRPLSNFEAYYLTDVDVELASQQMKKYDQLLLCGPPYEVR